MEFNGEKEAVIHIEKQAVDSFPITTEMNIEAALRRRVSEVITLPHPCILSEKKTNNLRVIYLPTQISKICSVSILKDSFD